MTSGSSVRHGTRGRGFRIIFRLREAKDDIRGIHSDSLLTNSQYENADALTGFWVAWLFHNLFQSWRSRFCAQLWTGVQACIYLHALLTAHTAATVPENEVSSCAKSLFIQHPRSSNTGKEEEKLELLQNRFCSSSAFATASAQDSLSAWICQCGDAMWSQRRVLAATWALDTASASPTGKQGQTLNNMGTEALCLFNFYLIMDFWVLESNGSHVLGNISIFSTWPFMICTLLAS